MPSWRSPGLVEFYRQVDRFESVGAVPDLAWAMAVLVWWGMGYGLGEPRITSGRRSRQKQRELRARFRRGEPGIFRPAAKSKHLTGEAVDLGLDSPLRVYGSWARLVGVKWAGSGDPVHFELA